MTTDPREREVRRTMAARELYSDGAPGLEGLAEERLRGKELADAYNRTGPRDEEGRRAVLKEMLAALGTGVWIEPPLHVAYGNRVHLGDDVYANFGLTLVDDVEVFVGDRVMFAPHVTVSTTGHPRPPGPAPGRHAVLGAGAHRGRRVDRGRCADHAGGDRRPGLGGRRGQCGDGPRAADDGRRRHSGPGAARDHRRRPRVGLPSAPHPAPPRARRVTGARGNFRHSCGTWRGGTAVR
ncbi:maltose acetyltransferase domain-containing protein [Streptomyces ambofaciens]